MNVSLPGFLPSLLLQQQRHTSCQVPNKNGKHLTDTVLSLNGSQVGCYPSWEMTDLVDPPRYSMKQQFCHKFTGLVSDNVNVSNQVAVLFVWFLSQPLTMLPEGIYTAVVCSSERAHLLKVSNCGLTQLQRLSDTLIFCHSRETIPSCSPSIDSPNPPPPRAFLLPPPISNGTFSVAS